MAGEVIVDALPYIDQGYDDPGVREAALAMVEEECRRYRPTKNYLEHLPPLNMSSFETEMMSNEFERIHNRLPMEPLSMKRYELPPPPPGKMSEILSWSESVDNSMAQLEHQAVRAINLELMLEYGIEAWKAYLEIFTALQAKAQNKLQDLKKEIQEVNWQRKSKQTGAGEKLRALEAQWVVLVSKNYEIEQACAKLEEEIIKCKISKGLYENQPTTARYEDNGAIEENGYKDNEMQSASNGNEAISKKEHMEALDLCNDTKNAAKLDSQTEKSKDEINKNNDKIETEDVEMDDENTT